MQKDIIAKKILFEKKVLNEAKRKMKNNKTDMNEIMLEKSKKDIYAKEVISCSKNMSLGVPLHMSQERMLKEKLTVIEQNVERTKNEIRKLRQKNWSEKGFKPRDIDAIRGVFVTKKRMTLEPKSDVKDNDVEIMNIARFS